MIPADQIESGNYYWAKCLLKNERDNDDEVVFVDDELRVWMVISRHVLSIEHFEFYEQARRKEKSMPESQVDKVSCVRWHTAQGKTTDLLKDAEKCLNNATLKYWPEPLSDITFRTIMSRMRRPEWWKGMSFDWSLEMYNILTQKEIQAGFEIQCIENNINEKITIWKISKRKGILLQQIINDRGRTIYICRQTKEINGG